MKYSPSEINAFLASQQNSIPDECTHPKGYSGYTPDMEAHCPDCGEFESDNNLDELLHFLCDNSDMTDEEVKQELIDDGVDLDAFHDRMHKVRDKCMKELRDKLSE